MERWTAYWAMWITWPRFERENLIERTDDGFQVTELGRPFVRAICAHFDTYLKRREAGHSTAV